jgi:cobalamin biosynthesis Mg chelatase CobN
MVDETKSANRDARVLQLYEELLEIEQRLIPTGLHVLGRPQLQMRSRFVEDDRGV